MFSAEYGHEKSFKELGDLGHKLFNFQKACIYTEIVVKLIAPAAVGVEFVIFRTLLVEGENVAFHFLFGKLFAFPRPLHTTLYAAFDVGVDKYSEGLIITQNIVGTSSDDNAIGFFGHTLDYFALSAVNGLYLLEGIFSHIGNALPGGYGI